MSTTNTTNKQEKEVKRERPMISITLSRTAIEVLNKAREQGLAKSTLVNILIDDWGKSQFPELY